MGAVAMRPPFFDTQESACYAPHRPLFSTHPDSTHSADFKQEESDRIKSSGRYRQQPDTFGGGGFCWTGGDDVGLRVDKDGFATDLLGGHVR